MDGSYHSQTEAPFLRLDHLVKINHGFIEHNDAKINGDAAYGRNIRVLRGLERIRVKEWPLRARSRQRQVAFAMTSKI